MFKLFDDIINGYLKPHLIKDDKIDLLDELLRTGMIVDIDENGKKIISPVNWFSHDLRKRRIIMLHLDWLHPQNNKLEIIQTENPHELINVNIPPPPNDIADKYLTLIERESELIKYQLNDFIINSDDIESNEIFALKKIRSLKKLAKKLRIYIEKLEVSDSNLPIFATSNFVSEQVLQYYIIDLIQFIQKTFSSFGDFNLESEARLRYDLFNYSIPRIPEFYIFPLLPKEKEFEDFKKEFLNDNKEELLSNKLKNNDISIGKSLFNLYKSKYKDLSEFFQIENYNKEVHFWNQLLITNKLKVCFIDTYINEPEIEKILIPLLKNEIKFLEKEANKQSISHAQIPNNKAVIQLNQAEYGNDEINGRLENLTFNQSIENPSDFFGTIKRNLLAHNYKIDGFDFDEIGFIEEMHNRSLHKGKPFYTTLANTMADICPLISDESKGELPTYQENLFIGVLDYCKKKIAKIDNSNKSLLSSISQNGLSLQQVEKKSKQKEPAYTFPEYIMHSKREEIAKELKSKFKIEKGKDIRLMLESLQAHKPMLLTIRNRKGKATYEALKIYFNRDIGTRQSVLDYNFNINKPTPDYEIIKAKVDFILDSIDLNQ